ncbi:EAL domain-containing response regulator [Sulfurimonas sp. SAG-AH-194-C21]|nr:EAL domain-containing response regulator [Sulfurimonas sp. SAG-AH-194-C21]MDF1882325.1 EAL domain-containing response regulator [Sulfurimonas sp. SAG-AH-194-C21]
MNKNVVIVVDDEVDLATFVCEVATEQGFESHAYHNGNKFLKEYDFKADVIFLDLMMPDIDGIEVIRHLGEHKCTTQLVLMSGVDSSILHSAQQLALAQGLNIITTITKPIRLKELKHILDNISKHIHLCPVIQENKRIDAEDLKKAFIDDELVVYYQPKLDLHDANVLAVEALVRWKHPTKGLIPPMDFISIAEENNLIDELTWIVLEKSLQQCAKWNQDSLEVKISVNMSAITLKDLTIPEFITKMLKKYKVKPSQLMLEVTESALMEELITSLDILTRLRLNGIALSIDDFGTGYSSLMQLHRVPFSEIKIDQSFVKNISNDPESLAIAETVLMLGHKLNMSVVAEGVEDVAVLQILKDMGCDKIQGYYIQKPQEADIITKWLKESSKRFG